jgi:hypothetical protein
MSAGPYSDYLWNFRKIGLARALKGLDALRAQLSLDTNAMLGDMLGDPRDANGNVVVSPPPAVGEPPDTSVVWVGRAGIAAYSYTNPATDELVEVPAKGDPSRYYMHIRSLTGAEAVGFNPADYGLTPTDPFESAQVLGLWAGDAMPERRR